jgi:hypothetical protein
MARLEALSGKTCPECAGWPAEVHLRIIEEIIEVGQPAPEPDHTIPGLFGPCCQCGRVHRAVVVEIEED